MNSALCLLHVPFENLGSLGEELATRGIAMRTVDACTADYASLDFLSPDLVVVMGGPIGVYETAAYPFLRLELARLRERLTRRLPTLGICLGAQLMAAALGASVYAGRNGKEIGWSRLEPGADAAACPAIAELLTPQVAVLHWHGDTFDLPQGAQHLAATPAYAQQAWCLGPSILGLQFHAEVLAHDLERWYVGHACELSGARIDVHQLRTSGQQLAPALYPNARRFWAHWLQSLESAGWRYIC